MPAIYKTSSVLLLVLSLGVFLESSSLADDWPSWRGPNRDGKSAETGLLTEWPEAGPPLTWRVKGLGKGLSSVAIADGRIFTMGKTRNGTELIALDAGNEGALLWSSPVGGGNPNCTPTVDGKFVYALGRDGDFVCVETESGAEVWRTSFTGDFGGRMMSGWGYSESPLIDGNRLICTPGAQDAAIVALNKKTGKVIWKSNPGDALGRKGNNGAAYSSIVVSQGAGVKQYIQLTGRGVISVRAEDGEFLWSYNRIANGTANIPTPIVKDDYVFCSTGYGTGAALVKLSPDGKGVNAEEVYFLDSKTMQNHHGGMILVGDYIYCGHGHNQGFPLCIKMETGEIVWRPGRGPGERSAAVVYADGHLYFRYENAVMALIKADPKEYQLVGSFKIAAQNGPSWPHPAISDGKLYLRDQDELLCYDIAKK